MGSNIVERCEEILDYRKSQVWDFHEENYVWQIGAKCLNELINELDIRYVPINRRKNNPTLFGIEYVLHPDNNRLNLVHKTHITNLNEYNHMFMVMPRQAGCTMNTYINLLKQIERSKNMNWRVKPEGRIENVIFNNPATIVFWDDGTKTVVKAEGEPFDPEKGLAMAIAKKSLGNQGNYYNEFKKWLPKEKKDCHTCKGSELSVSPYEDSLHPCNHCYDSSNYVKKDEEKKTDTIVKLCLNCKYKKLSHDAYPCDVCVNDSSHPNWEKKDD